MAFDLVGKAVRKLRLPTVNYDNTPIKVIPAQRGDANSRYFVIELFDDRGTMNLTPYSMAMLNATLPDESVETYRGEINKQDNTLTIRISGSMLKQTGRVACDVTLTGDDKNSELMQLTTQTFYLFVAESQSSDSAVEGDDDYSLLLELLQSLTALEDKVETAESGRVAAEKTRESNESTRQSNEAARKTAESGRESAEKERVSSESSRKTAESGRVSAESERVKAENARVEAEKLRASAENERKTAETARDTAEQKRETAETARANAEKTRETAESGRVAAEKTRESGFATAKSNCESATERANNLADSIEGVLDALPCETELQQSGGKIEEIVTLRFVEMGG